MSMYAQFYGQALQDAQLKYKKLHNLFLLSGLRKKIQCYQVHSAQPDRYYDCFYETESRMLQQTQEFKTNCDQIDDQYKICLADCKQNFKDVAERKQECFKKCGNTFTGSMKFLYENFYKTTVGKEPQYGQAKKI